LVKEIVEKEDK